MSDDKERLQALDPRHSFIVQAPAGSGKTELLTQRFLKLLHCVEQPEEILAVTFTRKAAAQMRQRILHALKKARHQKEKPTLAHAALTFELAQAVLKKDQRLQWDLELNPNRLRIVTIDSLCAYIVNKAPILSNFGGMPELLDFPDPFYIKATERLFLETQLTDDWAQAFSHLLMHLDNRIPVISQLLVSMLKSRDQWLPYLVGIKNQKIDLKNYLNDCFERMIDAHLQSLYGKLNQDISLQLIPLLRYAAENSEDCENNLDLFAEIDSLPKPSLCELDFWKTLADFLTTKKNEWRKTFNQKLGFPSASQAKNPLEKKQRQKYKQDIELLVECLAQDQELFALVVETKTLPPKELSGDQLKILNALAQLLPVLVGHLNVIFQESGKVDFTEVMLRAQNALGDDLSPSDIALRLDYQLSHILIDEYQDTSVSQFRLFEKIVAGWENQDGRTVFLVGDPMQSIYRFRGAKVSLFMHTLLHGLGPVKLKALQLKVNFRSNAKIIDWINQTFSNIFPEKDDQSLESVSYSKAFPCQQTGDDHSIQFHAVQGEKKNQAHKVAELALNALNTPSQKIAVLVRAKKHLAEIIQEFKRLNIPFVAHEVEHLAQRAHIIDLLSLLRATDDLTHRVSWFAILRAPWIGLELNDLFALNQACTSNILWEAIQHFEKIEHLSNDAKQRLSQKVPILKFWLNHRRRHVFHHWLRGLWIAMGGPDCYEAPHFLNDIDKTFELIKTYENANLFQIDDLEFKLEQLYGDITLVKPSNDPHQQNGVVELMTIHKAKGLEFDTVIMPHLEARTINHEQALLLWHERSHSEGIDLILAPRRAQHEKVDLLYQYVDAQIRKKADFEMERLLYVGVTRAKERLHLVMHCENQDERLKQPPSGSFMSKLWPFVQSALSQQAIMDRSLQSETLAMPETTLRYSRLPINWQLPQELQAYLEKNLEKAPDEDLNIPSSVDWVARSTGTVFHRLLQRWVNEGGIQSDALPLNAQRSCALALKQYGLYGSTLEQAVTLIMQALQNMLHDPKGKWILDPAHTHKETEWQLSMLTPKGIENNVIDYAFIDNTGTRWIVDYKLTQTTHMNEELLQQEIALYQNQLQRYRSLLQHLEKRPVRCGLYFPNSKLWWEMVS